MKFGFFSKISALVLIAVLLCCTGCSYLYQISSPDAYTQDEDLTMGTRFTIPQVTLLTPSFSTDPVDPNDPPALGTTAATTVPRPEPEPEYPTASNLVELRDILWQAVESGNNKPVFQYTGNSDDLKAQTVARILSAYYINLRRLSVADRTWQVEITGYPGDRIVAAHKSGDHSSLTADEKAALAVAEQVVEVARDVAENDMELELYLYDWLCDRVTYYGGSTNISNADEIVPHLTALGALLEGKANCQGYTDGFYVLASVAGFTVSRQSGENFDGGHSFNTIQLNGKWYVVDVTFDDDTYQYDGQSYHDYRLFNAGKDECGEYSWPEAYEYHPLVQTGGAVYYFDLPDGYGAHSYEKRFDDLSKMVNAVTSQWLQGRREFHLMLNGQTATWDDLSTPLSNALDNTGRAYNYRVWSLPAGENTYFYIRFQ